MRYATWKLLFTENLSEGGTAPLGCDGAFTDKESNLIVGYIPNDMNIIELTNWQVTEIDGQEFENLVIKANKDGKIVNGKAIFPL